MDVTKGTSLLLVMLCSILLLAVGRVQGRAQDTSVLGKDVKNFTLAVRADDANVPSRIVNGHDANIKDLPYQVALLVYSSNLICGGSVLNVLFILTAAHCTDGWSARVLSIRAGSTYKDYGGQVVQVSTIIQHPRYNRRTIDYDVSVLKLATKLTLSDAVKPIKIVGQGVTPSPGTIGTVSGWGDLQNGANKGSPNLQAVDLPAVSKQDCEKAYGQGRLTSRMVCYGHGDVDSCQGDSGGPLVVAGIQVGVVSFGGPCATPGFPGVYTNVADPSIHLHIEIALLV